MTTRINGAGFEGASANVGQNAHVEGWGNKAQGGYSHAEGNTTVASGQNSHAEGANTVASGGQSHAEGNGSSASGLHSHAQGQNTSATGNMSHAEGNSTTASGSYSRAGGNSSVASADFSQAWGNFTKAQRLGQYAQGSVSPGVMQSITAQANTYTIGAQTTATTSTYTELTMDGGAVVLTGVGCNVLVIPLKSLMLVTLSVVARPTNAAFAGSMVGCAWTRTVMVGRGNLTSTGAQMMVGTTLYSGGGPSWAPDMVYDTNLSSNQLAVDLNQGDTTNNYLRFRFFQGATSGYPMAVSGTLQVHELVTNA